LRQALHASVSDTHGAPPSFVGKPRDSGNGKCSKEYALPETTTENELSQLIHPPAEPVGVNRPPDVDSFNEGS